ncbi:hypothetical protein BZG36_03952 [Bifiguratus adelaidae]|uniref:COX assembly mitochondrial protein n=1 Tax=Bifiguratus adelaidae TaxID=1938954 RepID=A0A261XZW8_9FUNG|nr:hypothetical protein BZG36_03952 [Bifiguratus adelaidae]
MGKTQQSELSNPFVNRETQQLHALTRAEEEACFKDLKQRALVKCSEAVQDFVKCSQDHNVTVVITCRGKARAMNDCLKQYTTQEELDKLKLAKIERKTEILTARART